MNDVEFAEQFEMDELWGMLEDSGVETVDGCFVELDGSCPHGHKSPFLVLGLI